MHCLPSISSPSIDLLLLLLPAANGKTAAIAATAATAEAALAATAPRENRALPGL